MRPGDAYMLNDPYHGGTHLPDITVVTPAFDKTGSRILFYVASRAHHADIGGITPGSMPPLSRSIEEEGVLIRNFQLVDRRVFLEREVRELLCSARHPARNPDQNVQDLRAQLAANETGAVELLRSLELYGEQVVCAYMAHVQDNAEEQTRRALLNLPDGQYSVRLDNGHAVCVSIGIDRTSRTARIDFTGTSSQDPGNQNAPTAVTRAAVLYFVRTLLDSDISLNEGSFRPLQIVIPQQSMLNPKYPAAVVAGNVELSQCVTNALYGATAQMAGSQGTMNNLTFGTERFQYYETLCGGAGAGPGFAGAPAVHTHMTNSRLTDPEVLEWRYPVRIAEFSIRRDSGGRGYWSGGNGVRRRLHFLEPMTVGLIANNYRRGPFGLNGGEPGAAGVVMLERKTDGTRVALPSQFAIEVAAGDVLTIETPGGGGFGQSCSR